MVKGKSTFGRYAQLSNWLKSQRLGLTKKSQEPVRGYAKLLDTQSKVDKYQKNCEKTREKRGIMSAIARVRDVIKRIEKLQSMTCYDTMTHTELKKRTDDMLKELNRAERQMSVQKNSVIINKHQLTRLQDQVRQIRRYVNTRSQGMAVDDISYKITDLIFHSPEINVDECGNIKGVTLNRREGREYIPVEKIEMSCKSCKYSKHWVSGTGACDYPGDMKWVTDKDETCESYSQKTPCEKGELSVGRVPKKKTGDKMEIVAINKKLDLNKEANKLMKPDCSVGCTATCMSYVILKDGRVYEVEISVREVSADPGYEVR